jgi:hypothetical protein
MTDAAEALPGSPPGPAVAMRDPPVWVCHPNRLACQRGHVRRHHREGFHLDQRRLDGHIFAKCDECPSHFLGVAHAARGGAGGIIYCYAITETQWRWWNSPQGVAFELDEEQETLHLLYLLGYHDRYSPTHPTTGRPSRR